MNAEKTIKIIEKICKKVRETGGKAHFDLQAGTFDLEFTPKNVGSSLDIKLNDDEIIIQGSDTSVYEKFELMKMIWDEIFKRKKFFLKKNRNDVMVL